MTVLRVILFLLKLIGILLLVLIGIVLFVLLLGLTAPLRYRGRVMKEEVSADTFFADAVVSWLNPLIRIRFRFEEKKFLYKVRILGICVKNSEKPKKEKKRFRAKEEKKKKIRKEEITDIPDSETAEEADGEKKKVSVEDNIREPEKSLPEKTHDTQLHEKKGNRTVSKIKKLWNTIKEIPGKAAKGVQRVRGHVRILLQKKESLFSFLQDEAHTAAAGKALKEIKGVLSHILPRRIKGYVEFGTGEPESTGKALGVLGIFYAAYGRGVTIVPDFNEKRLTGNLAFRGRICLGVLLVRTIRLIRDKQIKQLCKDWKQLLNTLKNA